MNSIFQFIKKEFSGWKIPEILGLIIVLSVIIFNRLVFHDSIISVISAFCGILYTIIAGKGKVSCYLFGLTGSGFYAYLSFVNGFWGNFLLYLCYYVPMQIVGIFKWKNHLKPEINEIYKTKLGVKGRFILLFVSVVLCAAGWYILKVTGDTNPLADGVATALSLAGMYLTVKRCIEQWIVWSIVNLVSVIMWVSAVSCGARTYSTIVMWSTYLVLGIYFYFCWRKELINN